MKATKAGIGRSLDQPDGEVRLYLFHGPDEGQSRALGERLLKGLGSTRFIVGAPALKSDPALLADEAGAMNLFGEPRAIWVEPAGDEIAEAVEALLEAPASESPVIVIAGALRKSSALLKLAEGHRSALAHASYVPEGQQAERMVAEVGRAHGLRIAPGVAARVADACGNDQAIVGQELAKLALYVGASPEAPKDLDHDAVDAVGADLPEGDFLHLADLALAGEIAEVGETLGRLSPAGSEAIPVIRSLQRRLLMLAPMRARVEAGERSSDVMTSLGKSLFWKDKPLLEKLLATWDASGLETVAERAGKLERQLMRPNSPPPAEALGEELAAIARRAARRR
ncbi:DNA polymerase III subunit delta [Sphingomonas sp.]|uniref:DNA polymerase III subunit delta n=1 Tax=Sphingomonas sp. TaxID=28214 RepID=UPI0017C2E8FC|nr:DNA polymerase III subunit delta [Sphingomonas sp.]MBA3510427.1 DNA polymerase III subunit delta [Sphingomonas sp.]